MKDIRYVTEISQATGEVTEYEKMVFDDDLLEKERAKKHIIEKMNSREGLEDFLDEQFGKYFFYFYNALADIEIPANMKLRFLYLCSYITYDGYLYDQRTKRCISKKDLLNILNLSRRETYYTLDCLLKNNLLQEDDGRLFITPGYVYKGELTKKMQSSRFTRIFIEGIRQMYEQASPQMHRKLYSLFLVLPYIHLQSNIVCKNTGEIDLNYIEPYSTKDICTMCGYNNKNPSKFIRDLVDVKIGDAPIIGVVSYRGKDFIKINPSLYYGGTRIDELIELVEDFM